MNNDAQKRHTKIAYDPLISRLTHTSTCHPRVSHSGVLKITSFKHQPYIYMIKLLDLKVASNTKFSYNFNVYRYQRLGSIAPLSL